MNRLTEQAVAARLDDLLKPPGSLGQLERLAERLCLIQQTLQPQTRPRRLVLFAADHGVVEAGVSAWPASVTQTMVQTIQFGKSASAVLAEVTGTEIVLLDVGTFESSSPPAADGQVPFLLRKVKHGTRNLAREPALSTSEFQQALDIGAEQARAAVDDGARVLAAGEMGIGNTTPASCLAMLLAGVSLDDAVGRGAGVDDAGLQRKRQIVQDAVGRARHRFGSGELAAIASVSGLEIAAMAGFFMQASKMETTVVLDGFVASSAALIAERLQPKTASVMIAAHRSAEPGHAPVLEHLGLRGFLDWQMRLGEGTGALLLIPLLDAAAAMIGKMGRFSVSSIGKD